MGSFNPAGPSDFQTLEPEISAPMQAIISKYLPATNTKPSRIKASCERGSIVVSHPHELSGDACHEYAATQLCARFVAEDAKMYGSNRKTNPWARKRIMGTIPGGDVVHVFTA